MISRIELLQYLNEFLKVSAYPKDYAPNGLQVEGKPHISHICTAVTASMDAIEAAIAAKADVLLVHHGYFWRGEDPCVTGMKHHRLKALLAADLNLMAYHLPLDGHDTLGNNICFAQQLDLIDVKPEADQLLWTGRFKQPISLETCAKRIESICHRKPQIIEGHDLPISEVAFCTGAAQDFIERAASLSVQAFFSGEISERTYYQAKEYGVHYFACGHHATERDGIRALGKHLALTYGLTHQFIDTNNPV